MYLIIKNRECIIDDVPRGTSKTEYISEQKY